MPDQKITDFSAQSVTADLDVLASVDVSDTTDDVAGSSFKITFATLLAHYNALAATLTNKTLDVNGTGNVITNIGISEIEVGIITGATEDTAVGGTDELLGSDGALKRFDVRDVVFAVPYQIQLVPMVPQGTGAFAEVHALATTFGGKITGAAFPTGADGTFNLKADQLIPANLPSDPVFTVKLRFMASTAQTSATIHVELFYANIADNESYDATVIDDIADAAPTMSATIEVCTDLDLVLVTEPAAGDHFICQVVRDVSEDSYAGTAQLVTASLVITGS